ncbi:MAG TPA: TetR/AcrR family transcriptional regulator [Myxococcota bacterium]|nr:TetR/AcrR family transcriptional regulator [Myxococcota bacterium]
MSARRTRVRAAQKREAPAAGVDGRVQRGERNRDAIALAMFELVGEGVLEPTAEQVATRAGVGLRSVFRHFRDMESLYAEVDARVRRDALPIATAGVVSGSRSERARAMVERRARLFERISPFKRSANLNRQRSAYLKRTHRELVALLREHLLRWLPELAEAPPEIVAALELASSFEAWDRLRGEQGLSAARAHAAVEATVLALLRARPNRPTQDARSTHAEGPTHTEATVRTPLGSEDCASLRASPASEEPRASSASARARWARSSRARATRRAPSGPS